MRSTTAPSFWLAAALAVFAVPQFSHAQDMNHSNSSAQAQAAQMVPAQAVLATRIDASKMQPGTKFRATLSQAVRLDNGTELPHGTRLIGTVTSDSMAQGKAMLALRFTQADLKDGKTLPIKATIVDLSPGQSDYSELMDAANNPIPWDRKTEKVDAIGVLSGVDLHSNIAGNNSGVFVATKKEDVKLRAGSELSLAIGAKG